MKVIRYDYVIKVAELRSISKAAQELYMSQPALTKAINNIEEELGTQLFNRKVKPLGLTYAGEVFVDKARRILKMQNEVLNDMENVSNIKKAHLSVGISASRAEDYMPVILPIFKEKYPGVEISLVESPQETLEEKVLKENIDIAITSTPAENPEVTAEILTSEQVVIVMAKDNPILEGIDVSNNSLDNLVHLDPKKLDGADMISLSPGMSIYRFQEQMLEKYNIHPNVVLKTVGVETAFYLACVNYGFSIVPEACVIDEFPRWLPVICTLEYPSVKRETTILYKNDRQLSLAGEKFIELMKKIVNSDCPFFAKPSQQEFENARKKPNPQSDESLTREWQEKFLITV